MEAHNPFTLSEAEEPPRTAHAISALTIPYMCSIINTQGASGTVPPHGPSVSPKSRMRGPENR